MRAAPRHAADRCQVVADGIRLSRATTATSRGGMSAEIDETADRSPPDGLVTAFLPLSLLLSVRAHDRPGEILQDEDLSASLPRRLGLSGVVESQIQNYERAARRGRRVPSAEVANLIQLVLRRPDAEAILRDTGQRVAREHAARAPRFLARLLPSLPRSLSFLYVRRSAGRMLRRLVGGGTVQVSGGPLHVRANGTLAAALDPSGTACILYGGALEELVAVFTGGRPHVVHVACATRGAGGCEWVLAETDA